jgi:competence protein ComER
LRMGFIGTGSMGSMLIESFLRSQRADVSIIACNRSPEKIRALTARYPTVLAKSTPIEVARSCDMLFLCVKPGDALTVLQQIRPALQSKQYFLSISSAFSVEELESLVPCRVVKMIPSITQVVRSGVILTMYGNRLSEEERQEINTWLSLIGKPYCIEEKDTRVCADLTSCGPAFVSYLLREFARAAVRQGNLPEETAMGLVAEMAHGLGKLLVEGGFTFNDVIQRVSVRGGITEAGIHALEPLVYGVFDQLLLATRSHKHHPVPPDDKPGKGPQA